MLEKKTLHLLDISSQDLEEYNMNPEAKIKEFRASLKQKINYFEKKGAANKISDSVLKENQISYYFKQSLMDLENNRLEGMEIRKIIAKIKRKGNGKEAGAREIIDKFKNSLKTNDQQWRLVTDFMSELFEQVMQTMDRKDVR